MKATCGGRVLCCIHGDNASSFRVLADWDHFKLVSGPFSNLRHCKSGSSNFAKFITHSDTFLRHLGQNYLHPLLAGFVKTFDKLDEIHCFR